MSPRTSRGCNIGVASARQGYSLVQQELALIGLIDNGIDLIVEEVKHRLFFFEYFLANLGDIPVTKARGEADDRFVGGDL